MVFLPSFSVIVPSAFTFSLFLQISLWKSLATLLLSARIVSSLPSAVFTLMAIWHAVASLRLHFAQTASPLILVSSACSVRPRAARRVELNNAIFFMGFVLGGSREHSRESLIRTPNRPVCLGKSSSLCESTHVGFGVKSAGEGMSRLAVSG